MEQTLYPKGRASTLKFGTHKISQRPYFSIAYYRATKLFTDRARLANLNKQRGFNIFLQINVISSVKFAVAFIEASINEIFEDIMQNHKGYIEVDAKIQEKIKVFWEDEGEWLDILSKYQKALNLMDKKDYSKGEHIYQDVDLLIKLRNQLVHYKPQTSGSKKVANLSKKLKSKFEFTRQINADSVIYDDLLSQDCAEWAFKSSKALVDNFFIRLGIQPYYQRVDFSLMESTGSEYAYLVKPDTDKAKILETLDELSETELHEIAEYIHMLRETS